MSGVNSRRLDLGYGDRTARGGGSGLADRLPPHAIEAEQGVLGCVLLEPGACLPKVLERMASTDGVRDDLAAPLSGAGLFYDVRHEALFRVCKVLWEEKGTLDTIVLQQRLKDWSQLESVGGMAYIAGLMNQVPSAAAIDHYVAICWEKFLLRKALAAAAGMERRVWDSAGDDVERIFGAVEREFEEFKGLIDRNFGVSPQVLKRAGDFGDGALARWVHAEEEIPGWRLPFAFPLGMRLGELTLMSGDNGSGKTSMLSQMAVDVAKQIQARSKQVTADGAAKHYGTGDERICIASFEMSPDVSVWIAQRQILGLGRLPIGAACGLSTEGLDLFGRSLAWLNHYFWFHDFVGIGSWRDVLDVFRYARDHEGCRFFVLDSVMRIGIPEDDLAQQSLAAAAMASFVMEKGKESHLVVVGHENKGGEGAKNRVQGSKRWTDNAHLFVQMMRNEKKGNDLAEAKELGRSKEEIDRKKGQKLREECREKWDSKFLLHKQRYPGAPQNGSAHLFFDGGRDGSLQFRKELEESPICYLD